MKNDYSEGAHPRILDALLRTNLEQTDGYGEDPHTENACRLIRQQLGREDLAVHLLCGGTQTNLCLIAHALRPHQAVVAAQTGHICVHEAGAIEATGHKAIAVPTDDGKLTPDLVRAVVQEHKDCHMVQPRLVYISQSTEIGTYYTKSELAALYQTCQEMGLYLYMDGARLPSALGVPHCGIQPADLPALCDAFYLGGTKCGALMGEALVLVHPALRQDFLYVMKQRGALFAKGRVAGIQFEELMADGLYWELGRHANDMALQIREAIAGAGFPFAFQSETNQQFPILPNALCERMASFTRFEIWGAADAENTIVRLVTSWATRSQDVERFIADFLAAARSL